jgi:hypothetical protein
MNRRIHIAVIGASECSAEEAEQAYRVGRLVAGRGAVLFTGGLGGVMEAASRGAKEAGGLTVGILPGFSDQEANPYMDLPVTTGLSHARNVVLVRSCSAVIAVSGEYGTLSEIALALKLGKPVVALGGWEGIKGVRAANSPEDAVERAFELLG